MRIADICLKEILYGNIAVEQLCHTDCFAGNAEVEDVYKRQVRACKERAAPHVSRPRYSVLHVSGSYSSAVFRSASICS